MFISLCYRKHLYDVLRCLNDCSESYYILKNIKCKKKLFLVPILYHFLFRRLGDLTMGPRLN